MTLILSELHFENRRAAPQQKPPENLQEEKPFCPLSRNINHQFLAWQLIENQPLLRQIYKGLPIVVQTRKVAEGNTRKS